MGWVTDDQLQRAREVPVLDYMLANEYGNYKLVGREYRHKEHPSLAVGENGWYWHSKSIGSWSALDYLVEVHGYGLVEAVCTVLGEKPQERPYSQQYKQPKQPKQADIISTNKYTSTMNKTSINATPASFGEIEPPEQRPPLSLPLRHKDNNRVIAYLQSREIDKDLIMDCIKRGVLFQSKYYHNAVFLGKDENGKTRFAAMRSTTTRFMQDAEGSDKRYGFVLPPDNPNSHIVAVYEAPIDCLSHQTLCKQGYIPPFDGWRLSLGGTSPLALEHFLENNSNVTHCIIATDNDDAGEQIAEKIIALAAAPGDSAIYGITTERSLPPYGDDWNKTLGIIKKAERTQGKVRQSCNLEL